MLELLLQHPPRTPTLVRGQAASWTVKQDNCRELVAAGYYECADPWYGQAGKRHAACADASHVTSSKSIE